MIRFFTVIFLTLFFSLKTSAQHVSFSGLTLVGNNTGLKAVTSKQAASIFKGNQSHWTTKEQVIIVMPTSRADFSEQFATGVINGSHSTLQKYWLALVFQGRSSPPVFLNSSEEILDFVRRNPGSIAFLDLPEREIPSGLLIRVTDN